ncbi:hypothetical protein [Psychrobacter sp. I-STPA6b]|uniref:hypothetical protein n=1 Tax=Psychrobacter sp. I-STPA6b TaxID=2585718 RepID=UPI001D0C6B9A|nr:hypothetical protein [Psychrobacter sp. I-STPA6b]
MMNINNTQVMAEMQKSLDAGYKIECMEVSPELFIALQKQASETKCTTINPHLALANMFNGIKVKVNPSLKNAFRFELSRENPKPVKMPTV